MEKVCFWFGQNLMIDQKGKMRKILLRLKDFDKMKKM